MCQLNCSTFLIFFFLLVIISFIYALPPRANDKFFIYDWPDVCTWLSCMGVENYGAGKELSASNGVFDTYQYHLFNVIYARALQDPRRTLDPEEATSFFIPYDSQVDAMTFTGKEGHLEVSWELGEANQAPKVHDLLLSSPYFQRKKGKDHFMVVSWNGAMFMYILKPKAVPLFRLCNHCIKLAVDNYSFLYDKNNLSLPEKLAGENW